MPTPNQLRGSCVAHDDAAPSGCARLPHSEAAFTLVELLIAFVLFAVASAIVLTVVMQGLAGSSNSRAGGVSDAAIRRTVETLHDDIALAATEDTRAGNVRDELMLASAVRTGSTARRPFRSASGAVDPSLPLVAADIDEVRIARPDQLQLIVDGECVTWRTATATRDGRRMVDVIRTAAPASNCSATTEQRRYLSAVAGVAGVDATPFSYRLMCNPRACAGSLAASHVPCRQWKATGTVPHVRRRWVVGVDATLASVTAANGGSGAASETVSATIDARATEQYREALGC